MNNLYNKHEDFIGGKNFTPSDSGLTCPITGGKLLYIGYELAVMDPDSFYQSEKDPTLYFACHPFSRSVYRLIDRPSMMEKSKRYFVLNEDKSWTEHIKIENGNLVPIDTPQSEIDEANEKYKKEKEERRRNYDERIKRGEIIPLNSTQVYDKFVSLDIIEVKPMAPPTNMLFYLNYKIDSSKFEEVKVNDDQTVAPGVVFVPWVLQDSTGKTNPEYETFMKDYHEKHSICPKCGHDKHSVTLMSYPLDMNNKEDYKDLNQCVCAACGDQHTVHERTVIYF